MANPLTLTRSQAWHLKRLDNRRAAKKLTAQDESLWRALKAANGETVVSNPPKATEARSASPIDAFRQRIREKLSGVVDDEIERQDRAAFANMTTGLMRDRIINENVKTPPHQKRTIIDTVIRREDARRQRELAREAQKLVDARLHKEAARRYEINARRLVIEERARQKAEREAERERERLEKVRQQQQLEDWQNEFVERRRARLEQEDREIAEEEARIAANEARAAVRLARMQEAAYRHFGANDIALLLEDDWKVPHYRAEQYFDAVEIYNGDGGRHCVRQEIDIDQERYWRRRGYYSANHFDGPARRTPWRLEWLKTGS